ncbi:MAG: hypothetical protein WB507_06135 [Solirubrobacterales bacterium]
MADGVNDHGEELEEVEAEALDETDYFHEDLDRARTLDQLEDFEDDLAQALYECRECNDEDRWVTYWTTEPVCSLHCAVEAGVLHREYGPAVEWDDGCYRWYFEGPLHREGSEPAVDELTREGGSRQWREHGRLHRLDGPAYIAANGVVGYYRNGVLHRDDDGPAWTGEDER